MRRLKRFAIVGIPVLLLICSAFASEKSTAPQLSDPARSNSPNLRDAITATFDAKDLKEGTAAIALGPDFFFAVQAPSKPELLIDGVAGPQMQNSSASDLWYAPAHIEPVGKLHSF